MKKTTEKYYNNETQNIKIVVSKDSGFYFMYIFYKKKQ